MATLELRKQDPGSPCVWVSAGLLRHHLCDRDYDCDHCPLHLAISPAARRTGPERAVWPRDRLYSGGHFWLQQYTPTRARVGLTEMAARLLHPVRRWNVHRRLTGRAEEVRIEADLPCCRVTLTCPCSTGACVVNPLLAIDALWPAADPWLSGFLFEFDLGKKFRTGDLWMELSRLAPHYAHHRELVHRALLEGKTTPTSANAQDGGLPSAGLLPVVGGSAYAILLSAVLRGTVVPADS